MKNVKGREDDGTKTRRVIALAMDLYIRQWVKPRGDVDQDVHTTDPNEFLAADCIDAADRFYVEADTWAKEQS